MEKIGEVLLTSEFTTSIISILSSIEKDSSLDCNVLFLLIKDKKLSISRKNRYSEISINYHMPVECADLKVPIIFDDFVKIFKSIKCDSMIQFFKEKILIKTEHCEYSIQNYNFDYVPFVTNEQEFVSKFSISNSIVKDIYSSIVVAPLKRNPPVLDSIFIKDGRAYCLDHSVLSSYKLSEHISFEKPIPLFLFQVAGNMSDDCSVDFSSYNNIIIISFNIDKIAHVKAISSCLAGEYPIDKLDSIFQSFNYEYSFNVDRKEFFNLIKSLNAISDKRLSICNGKIVKDCINFSFSEHEKHVDAVLQVEMGKIPKITSFNIAINNFYNILKHMDSSIDVSITDKFLILFDTRSVHVIPLLTQ